MTPLSVTLRREPFTLPLGEGLVVTARPASTDLVEAAEAAAEGVMARIADDLSVLDAYGLEGAGDRDLEDAAVRTGLALQITAVELAERLIVGWELNGEAVKITPKAIRNLMHDADIARRWRRACYSDLRAVVLEGNASGPASDGNSETGPKPAGDATNSAPPAPAADEGGEPGGAAPA